MNADRDISDIRRQGDLAGAGDSDCPLGRLGLHGDAGWAAGGEYGAKYEYGNQEDDFCFHKMLLIIMIVLYIKTTDVQESSRYHSLLMQKSNSRYDEQK